MSNPVRGNVLAMTTVSQRYIDCCTKVIGTKQSPMVYQFERPLRNTGNSLFYMQGSSHYLVGFQWVRDTGTGGNLPVSTVV